MQSERVEVTEADRKAADALDDALGFLTAVERPIVEQFLARHRLSACPEGWVMVPRELVQFLMGEEPINGTWFGDLQEGLPGRFWWRALLSCGVADGQRLLSASPDPTSTYTSREGEHHG